MFELESNQPKCLLGVQWVVTFFVLTVSYS